MKRSMIALLGAAGVVVIGLVVGLVVRSGPDTAPIAEPERDDTVQDLPAGRAVGNEQPAIHDEN